MSYENAPNRPCQVLRRGTGETFEPRHDFPGSENGDQFQGSERSGVLAGRRATHKAGPLGDESRPHHADEVCPNETAPFPSPSLFAGGQVWEVSEVAREDPGRSQSPRMASRSPWNFLAVPSWRAFCALA